MIRISRQVEKLSTGRSILGTNNEPNKCTRSDRGVSSRTSRSTSMGSKHGREEEQNSTKGAKEIIWVAGWEI